MPPSLRGTLPRSAGVDPGQDRVDRQEEEGRARPGERRESASIECEQGLRQRCGGQVAADTCPEKANE